jgi:hypothetical protein
MFHGMIKVSITKSLMTGLIYEFLVLFVEDRMEMLTQSLQLHEAVDGSKGPLCKVLWDSTVLLTKSTIYC